jgi:hypothetical protein
MFCCRCRQDFKVENLRQYPSGRIACVWCIDEVERHRARAAARAEQTSFNRDQDLIFGVGGAGIGACVGGPIGAAVGGAAGLATSWLLVGESRRA